LFSRHKRKAAFLFAVSDLILTALSFEAAYQSRAYLPLERAFYIVTPVKVLLLGVALLSWLALGLLWRVYERLETSEPRAALQDSFRQVASGILVLVGFLFLMKLDVSRLFIALFGLFNLLALIAFRVSARSARGYLRRRFGAVSYIMIVGTGEAARRIGRELERGEDYGVRLLAFLDAEPAAATVELERTYFLHRLGELGPLLRRHVVDEIVFAVEPDRLASLGEVFRLCEAEGVRTRVAVNFFPNQRRAYLEQLGPYPLLTFSGAPHDEIRLLVKRALDLALASIVLVIAGLPLVCFAALVKLTSRGPAIFKQVRCGLNGRRFHFYKLRSMREDAESRKAELEPLNERDGPVFKMANDPRRTSLGRYLRRYSIDEWPQLWNVLRGDMSLVGPRPAVPSEVDQYQPWQRRRLRMKPGLICLWALEGRDRLDFETWMRLDLEYIDNWSLLLDCKILLRSIPMVLSGRGAS